MTRFLIAFMFLMSLFGAANVSAEDPSGYMLDEIRLNTIGDEVSRWSQYPPSADHINRTLKALQEITDHAASCSQVTEEALSQVQEKSKVVDSADDGAENEIAKRRKQFQLQQTQLQQRLALCRLLGLSSRELHKKIVSWRQKHFTNALLIRNDPIWTTLYRLPSYISSGKPIIQLPQLQKKVDFHLIILAGLFPLLFLVPFVIAINRQIKELSVAESQSRGHKALMILGRRLPLVALLASAASGLLAGEVHFFAIPLAAMAMTLTLAPFIEQLLNRGNLGVSAALTARWFATLIIIIEATEFMKLKEVMAPPVYGAGRSAMMGLLFLVSARLLWVLCKHPGLSSVHSARFAILFGLGFGPAAEWLGFQNLASFASFGIFGTLIALLLYWLVFLGLEKGKEILQEDPPGESAQTLRRILGYRLDEPVKGLLLFRRVIMILLILGAGYTILRIWDLTAIKNTTIGALFVLGFQIGETQIVPIRITMALLLFLTLINLSRWMKRQMEQKWLIHSTMDKGAKQSVVTLSGYLISGFALIYCLSIAGLEFKNLAIIAGALSVGIGFGLQNIVNNFVSGLILLFERPVRPGDWVVVGQTEGYVKRVSIRYTQIQTFDRADVLVPNSELISNHVTNWMLGDPFGRVIVDVGVAYGSDTAQVHDILLNVACEHPMVLTNTQLVPEPRVLFIAFGDSALDFQLRCHIRDIDYRTVVRSELLFAIEAAFRKEGIQIPFPQRVLHHIHPENKD